METEQIAVEVLKVKSQIEQARAELRRRGLSCTESKVLYYARRLILDRTVKVGDVIKSWDVLKTAGFIEKTIAKDASILDIGVFASEILCVLHRLGYSHLTGIDLNPGISRMPYADKILYVISNFMRTPFNNESFEVITSTSVIEHGFNDAALLTEISRLLRPGGYFIASFDYWPEKIDTAGIHFFGMNWKIFSQQEVLAFIDEARIYKLVPAGKVNLKAQETPINCANKNYTFAWLALKKV